MCQVLVVDNDAVTAETVRDRCERAGFRVRVAPDGFDAIVAIVTRRPDVIVSVASGARRCGAQLANMLRSQQIDIPMLRIAGDCTSAAPATLDTDALMAAIGALAPHACEAARAFDGFGQEQHA